MGNKPVKKKNNINTEAYVQDNDILNYMKKNPPKLPNIYNHDYDFKSSDKNYNNDTCGKINKGAIPVVFLGHLMIEKKKVFNNLSITQRHKKKLLTIIYYTP